MDYHYKILSIYEISPFQVEAYWQSLYSHDRLRDRLLDIVDPTWTDVRGVLSSYGQFMGMLVRYQEDESNFMVVGEFQLAGSIGRSAQVHFSINPEFSLPEKVKFIRIGSGLLLQNAEIESLVGLTPFRHVRLILNRSGWEYRGILQGSVKSVAGYLDSYIMVYQ